MDAPWAPVDAAPEGAALPGAFAAAHLEIDFAAVEGAWAAPGPNALGADGEADPAADMSVEVAAMDAARELARRLGFGGLARHVAECARNAARGVITSGQARATGRVAVEADGATLGEVHVDVFSAAPAPGVMVVVSRGDAPRIPPASRI